MLPLNNTNIEDLDAYQRQTFRRFLHLPPGTASSGLYIVLGQLPICDILARNILTLFVNIVRYPGTAEYQIIQRQLAVKGPLSNSWVNTVKSLLVQYNLPSAYDILANPPSKFQWKATLKRQIVSTAKDTLLSDARRKVSLKYLNIEGFKQGYMHPSLASVANSPRDIIRSGVKVRFLLGQYRLLADIAKQSGGSPTCKLCASGPEDLYHIVFYCPKLNDLLPDFIRRASEAVPLPALWRCIPGNVELTLQLLIDCSRLEYFSNMDSVYTIESLTRTYFYAIHCRRSVVMK